MGEAEVSDIEVLKALEQPLAEAAQRRIWRKLCCIHASSPAWKMLLGLMAAKPKY